VSQGPLHACAATLAVSTGVASSPGARASASSA
jgi:hypothetical protein